MLGAGINQRCAPNSFAIQRVLLASRLYAEGRAPHVLITGGRPRGTPCSVAGAMAAMATRLGIPSDQIRLEAAARNTWQNAAFSHPILQSMGARRIVLVTDRLHMPRAEACFRAFGYDVERASVQTPDSHPDHMSMLYLAVHETVAWGYYWVKFGFKPHRSVVGSPPALARDSDVPVTRPPAFPNGPIIILGASYAAGWKPVIQGRDVLNKGVAGQQSFELSARFDADVAAHRPRAVVIWGFINDVFRSPRDRTESARARVRQEMATMVERARRLGIEPILTTEVTVRGPAGVTNTLADFVGWLRGKTSYQDYINGHVLDVNRWMRAFAAQEGLFLLDLQPVLSSADGRRLRDFADADGSHISPAGYAVLDHYAVPLLEGHLAAR